MPLSQDAMPKQCHDAPIHPPVAHQPVDMVSLRAMTEDAAARGNGQLEAAFYRLAKSGHTEGVRLLLPHVEPRSSNSLALCEAAAAGHAAMVELLLPHSDPSCNTAQALRAAAKAGHLRVVKLLLPHANTADINLAIMGPLGAAADAKLLDARLSRDVSFSFRPASAPALLDVVRHLLPLVDLDHVAARCVSRQSMNELHLLDEEVSSMISAGPWTGTDTIHWAAVLPKSYATWQSRNMDASTPLAGKRVPASRL
jgi:hypothetical protein